MTKENIQVCCLDGRGSAASLALEKMSKAKQVVWAHMTVPAVKHFLNHCSHVPALVSDVLTAEESRPRIIVSEDTILATFRGVNLNQDSDPEDMVSVRVWATKNMIVTVSRRKLASINDIASMLDNGAGPQTSAEFLETLLSAITDYSLDVADDVDDQLDQIEDRLSADRISHHRQELNQRRRQIILLRRYLVPQREAINRIPVDKISWLTDKNLLHFREIADANTRLLEDLAASKERANILYESLFAMAQEAMNQKMYILAIVAVIFMPLSFLTGLFGINVGGIPGGAYRYAFWIFCAVLFVILIAQFYWLRRRKWL